MKIRSITYFCNPLWPLDEKRLRQAGTFAAEARAAFEAAGYEVQSTRLATTPFPELLEKKDLFKLPELAAELGRLLPEIGIAHAALGPALPSFPESYALIPEAIAASKNIFFSGSMAEPQHGISLSAVKACAGVIVRTAALEPNGFANLNFAALANVPPGAPFFPAAYHRDEAPMFALAMEAAEEAVRAFTAAPTIEAGRAFLVKTLEQHAQALTRTADFLKYKYRLHFEGIDYSLAPFPEELRSLGTAFERMGVPAVGRPGSLLAAAVLTEAIERARFPRAGFSGLMLPVLEDTTLARRAAEGTLTVKDLLLYSAVCGTGLDTVPLPGNVSAAELTPLLLDLAALALRLDKPLTARLMPIPGKSAGDSTAFQFGYFANSRVMALDAMPLRSTLAADQEIHLLPRRHS
jgi:hypothetical protein